MRHRAPDAAGVTPHQLREVSPRRIERPDLAVGILGLLLVPAVGGLARELDPPFVVALLR
jgi:hypothetical protein